MMKLELTNNMFNNPQDIAWGRLKNICNVPENVKDEDVLITLWIDKDNSMAEVFNDKTGNLIKIGEIK